MTAQQEDHAKEEREIEVVLVVEATTQGRTGAAQTIEGVAARIGTTRGVTFSD